MQKLKGNRAAKAGWPGCMPPLFVRRLFTQKYFFLLSEQPCWFALYQRRADKEQSVREVLVTSATKSGTVHGVTDADY